MPGMLQLIYILLLINICIGKYRPPISSRVRALNVLKLVVLPMMASLAIAAWKDPVYSSEGKRTLEFQPALRGLEYGKVDFKLRK